MFKRRDKKTKIKKKQIMDSQENKIVLENQINLLSHLSQKVIFSCQTFACWFPEKK